MSNLVLFSDVLQSPEDFGLKQEDINLRKIAHEPTRRTLLLPSDKTGWYDDQLIVTQKKHTWHSFLYEGKVAITTGETTDFELGLGGSTGYDNGKDCLREINKLYLSQMTEMADLTKDMYNKMPEILKAMCYLYWLFEQFDDGPWHGLQYVYSSGVSCNILYRCSSGSAGSYSLSYAVRPTLYLKSGICIDLDQWLYTREPATLFLPESENQPKEVTMEMLYAEIKGLKGQIAEMEKKFDKRLNFIGAILKKFNKN